MLKPGNPNLLWPHISVSETVNEKKILNNIDLKSLIAKLGTWHI